MKNMKEHEWLARQEELTEKPWLKDGEKPKTKVDEARKTSPIVPGSEYKDVVDEQFNEEDPSSFEYQQEQRMRSGKIPYRTPEGLSENESYESRFVIDDKEVTDDDKEDILNHHNLSIKDLDDEDLEEFLSVKDKEGLARFEKHLQLQADYKELEKLPYRRTTALLGNLPYEQRKIAESEIQKVREKYHIDENVYKTFKSRERYLHNRKKNAALNEVMQKYFSTKEGERVDFGKEEPEKYETPEEIYERRVRQPRKEAAKRKYFIPWKFWKLWSPEKKEKHTRFVELKSEKEKYISPPMTAEEKAKLAHEEKKAA